MLHEVPYQRWDVLIFAASHDVIVKQLLAVLDAEFFLNIRLCRIDAAGRIVGVTADDSLLFQHDNLQAAVGLCRRHCCRESRSASAYDGNIACTVFVGFVPIRMLAHCHL